MSNPSSLPSSRTLARRTIVILLLLGLGSTLWSLYPRHDTDVSRPSHAMPSPEATAPWGAQLLSQAASLLPFPRSHTTDPDQDDRVFARQLVLDKELVFVYPKHYCPLGNSKREELLWSLQQPQDNQAQRLLFLGVDCEELQAFRTGRRNDLDHWFKLEVMESVAKALVNTPLTRDEFLSKASQSPILSEEVLSKHLTTILNRPASDNMHVQYVGRNHDALYYVLKATYPVKGKPDASFKLSALGGMTLVKNLPLTLTAYAREEASPGHYQLIDIVDTVVRETIQINERSLVPYLDNDENDDHRP